MLFHRAYRYEMNPNATQRIAFARHAGVARFAFNWGLARRIRYYRLFKKSANAARLKKHLNKIKAKRFPWLSEVSTYAVQSAMADLDKAFANFFAGLKKGSKTGFPKFKKKGKSRDSFRLYGSMHVYERHVQLPRIGAVRLKELPKVEGKIKSMTVSREADRWYVSIATEREVDDPMPSTKPPCGIDLGLNTFATIASDRPDGSLKIRKVKSPKPLKTKLRRLKILQRRVSRKQKGSNNRKKAVMKVARLHRRIRNIRQDFTHKLSHDLTKKHGAIRVENLNIKGMMAGKLAKSVSDAGWNEFLRRLEYKTQWQGGTVEKADRYYPSSKLCSDCGYKLDFLSRGADEWDCPVCSSHHDRDGNAATNLLRNTTVRTTANVSGPS